MGVPFHIQEINLGPASFSTGHEAYLRAVYNPPNKAYPPSRIIYKKNKYGRSELSRMEVMFSQLARLFLLPDLTPSLNLVEDNENNVVGLAIQHLCYVIEKKEGLEQNFYTLNDSQGSFAYAALKVTCPTKIPIYFLDKLPQGFYAKLVQAEANGFLTVDYESLASILATSYTLEEDDLHKGNFGFYLSEREGKPHAVFFKIDHDLMFVDSIMGFHTNRFFHLAQGSHAFDITVADLMSLVCLKNSSNSYWPTKFSYLARPFNGKEYHNYADINAFARLSTNRHFIKAKWKSFYKHILIPDELIDQTLKESSEIKKSADRANIALIAQATTARLARLRAVLFSIKEFRDYVCTLTEEETQILLKEVIPPHVAPEKLTQQVQQSFARYQKLCQSENKFETGDTPLHTAIKLGEYRYEETLRMFGQFINVKNKEGKTALDVALDQVNSEGMEETDARKNSYLIMKHLLNNGAKITTKYKESAIKLVINAYKFKNPYLEGITAKTQYQQFKEILRDIGEDHRFSLKSKKILARECMKQFITVNEHHPHFEPTLLRLKNDINGYSSAEESAGVKYIRQLRSKLWIIRQLRGLYGFTSTQGEINALINDARQRIRAKEPGCFSFFSNIETKDKYPDAAVLDDNLSLAG